MVVPPIVSDDSFTNLDLYDASVNAGVISLNPKYPRPHIQRASKVMPTPNDVLRAEILANATLQSDRRIESKLFLPVLNQQIEVRIGDWGGELLSSRQLVLLTKLVSVQRDKMPEIELQLFLHWKDAVFQGNVPEHEFDYENASQCYSACSSPDLELDSYGPNIFLLSYDVPWDREHGAGVWVEESGFQYGNIN